MVTLHEIINNITLTASYSHNLAHTTMLTTLPESAKPRSCGKAPPPHRRTMRRAAMQRYIYVQCAKPTWLGFIFAAPKAGLAPPLSKRVDAEGYASIHTAQPILRLRPPSIESHSSMRPHSEQAGGQHSNKQKKERLNCSNNHNSPPTQKAEKGANIFIQYKMKEISPHHRVRRYTQHRCKAHNIDKGSTPSAIYIVFSASISGDRLV